MKKLFIILIAFLSSNIFADYSTPNTSRNWNLDSLVMYSGGVVTFSSGAYMVNQTVNVLNSDTLKILSNATVKLAMNVVFNFKGTLIVNPPDSVKFTSIDTTQKFTEVRFDSSSASVVKKLIFEYSFNGFRMLDCSPLIDGCTFRYNCYLNPATTAPTINLFRSNAIISNCRIFKNYKVAIGGGSNISNAPFIFNNDIYENNYANANASQINLGASGSNTTIIRGNRITGMYIMSGGIATLPSGMLTIIIENNIIKKNRYGIAIQSSGNAIIRNNVIDSNNIQGVPNLGGSGINFLGSGVSARVSKNVIRGNLWGITIQSSAQPNLGDLTIPDTLYEGKNQIYNNNNSGIFYDLYNNTPGNIKAENNYWGTTNIDTIESHIFHDPDDTTLGFVDYFPILTTVGVTTLSGNMPAGFRLYDAYPNPFNPVTKIRFDIPESEMRDADIELSIFDVTGRLVRTIARQKFSTGSYEFDFDGSDLSSGVYFYTLSTPFFVESKKLVLLK